MEHLDLFSDRGAQAPNSKAARAVAALDALLQDLAGSEEVWDWNKEPWAYLQALLNKLHATRLSFIF